MQFCEDDSRCSCESESRSHGSDAQKGSSDTELILKMIHLFLPRLWGAIAIQSNVLQFQALEMSIQLVHNDFVVGEDDDLHVILQDGSNVLLYWLYFGETWKKVASHDLTILSFFLIFLFFSEHVHDFLAASDVLNRNRTT